jgi:hypothetical protein
MLRVFPQPVKPMMFVPRDIAAYGDNARRARGIPSYPWDSSFPLPLSPAGLDFMQQEIE